MLPIGTKITVVGSHSKAGKTGVVVGFDEDNLFQYMVRFPYRDSLGCFKEKDICPTFDEGDQVKLADHASSQYPMHLARLSFTVHRMGVMGVVTGLNTEVLVVPPSPFVPFWIDAWNLVPAQGETEGTMKKCDCPVRTLMIKGCQCGGV